MSKTFMDDVVKSVKNLSKLHSNEPIIKVAQNMTGGFEAAGRVLGKDKMGIGEAMTRTFASNADDLFDKSGKRIADAKANWNYGKIAGSYIGVSAAARVATGGGLYRDKNGNTNLIGVPFI